MPRRTERQKNADNLVKTFLNFCRLRRLHFRARSKLPKHKLNQQPAPDLVNAPESSASSRTSDSSSLALDLGLNPHLAGLSSNFLSNPSLSVSSSSSASSPPIHVNSSSSGAESTSTSSSSDDESSTEGSAFSFMSYGVLQPLGSFTSSSSDSILSSSITGSDSTTKSTAASVSSQERHHISLDEISEFGSPMSLSDTFLSDTESKRGRAFLRSLGRLVRKGVKSMYEFRYEKSRSRKTQSRPCSDMHQLLQVDKHSNPDDFRLYLRVTPATFDKMTSSITAHPVFSNNSTNTSQMPVEDQLAITLFRFGHFGNAAGLRKTARWSGYGKGTILLATRRVITALLSHEFMSKAVRLPTDEEKERAKEWVMSRSCREWRHGWCMVDGTLIPLFDRPYWYGESYFDRKCNYSLNIQVISLPNLCIIDFGYGFTGSTHDSTAWEHTKMYLDHDHIFKKKEFIWGDSAYPINSWVLAPYKKPLSEVPENAVYNNYVSMIRIRSEHTIGFLKGRFQSLKGLRINIKNEATHKFATYWIISCIALHSFAMECEADECGETGMDYDINDPFLVAGLADKTSSDSDNGGIPPVNVAAQTRTAGLTAGKARREGLKAALLRSKVN